MLKVRAASKSGNSQRVSARGVEVVKYIKGINKVKEERIFERRHTATRGHSFKLEGQRFKSNIRKYYFTERVVDAWNSLPAEVVAANTVNEFKHKAILHIR
ncbi:hypothetical protein [Ralstonia pseudosolanacearum]|uniref:hypothetical protein n=1 Tax=Ralstonia pseudosolanacearum TaxID=1310165 RepID=UPI003CF63652